MKKKLDTRFPAGRIRKIMQADEDVGMISMAVPLLVCVMHCIFMLLWISQDTGAVLQDLCNRTHEITLKKGAKIVNSLHLEILSKVPALGEPNTLGEDHAAPKRRKVIEDGEHDSYNESKRSQGRESIHSGRSMRGRGKGRGQGRDQCAGGSDGDMTEQNGKFEDDADLYEHEHDCEYPEREDIGAHHSKSKEYVLTVKSEELPDRNFDLNVSLDENDDSEPMVSVSTAGLSVKTIDPDNNEDYPGWLLSEVEKMAIDPLQLANFNRGQKMMKMITMRKVSFFAWVLLTLLLTPLSHHGLETLI